MSLLKWRGLQSMNNFLHIWWMAKFLIGLEIFSLAIYIYTHSIFKFQVVWSSWDLKFIMNKGSDLGKWEWLCELFECSSCQWHLLGLDYGWHRGMETVKSLWEHPFLWLPFFFYCVSSRWDFHLISLTTFTFFLLTSWSLNVLILGLRFWVDILEVIFAH
jgi:hypothetical protein